MVPKGDIVIDCGHFLLKKGYEVRIFIAVTVLQTLVIALGVGLGIWGAINHLEGYGNDNPGAKLQGMKQLMAGGGVDLIEQSWYRFFPDCSVKRINPAVL